MSADPPRSPLPADLAALRHLLETANPGHYRELALYLQILRDVLPSSVDQAIFQLATQIHPGRYAALPADRRTALHQRISNLVKRCASLLTVEQLSGLAARLHHQRLRRRRDRQRLLMERLMESTLRGERGSDRDLEPVDPRSGDSIPAVQDPFSWGIDQPPLGSAPLPPGSVRLELDLPLRHERIGWASALAESLAEINHHDALDEPAPPDDEEDAESEEAIASLSWSHASEAGGGPLQDQAGDDPDAEDGELEPAEVALDSPWSQAGGGGGLLPRDPVLLESWLVGYDQALSRRLRNLSHAINAELMRCNLLPILLPASLLDAVLEGKIETLGAPPNLLRLQLPMALPGIDQALQATVLLLRCADLELEQPKLRTVRRGLQRRRQEGRRMAQHHRRLQRRLQAREAEALWLQDIRTRQAGASQPHTP